MSLGFLAQGCSSAYFLFQAGRGQLRLLNRGLPLAVVIADPTTDPKLAALLRQVPLFKKFAEAHGLKSTPNYQDYVKLDQDAVNYVVTVSKPLQFEPKIFSFPIVGSFSYIGWFSREDAEQFAQKFAEKGLDTDVRGARAYSTLGWFQDPLLSSMIPMGANGIDSTALPELLNVVLHESVHATLYLNDQSYFNESIASFVADQLTERFFVESNLKESTEWKSYLRDQDHSQSVGTRMAKAYQELSEIYKSSDTDSVKTDRKRAYLSALQAELKFKRPITNATLIQFQTYEPSDSGFDELYKRCGQSVKEMLRRLATLRPADFESIGCKKQCEKFRPLIDRL